MTGEVPGPAHLRRRFGRRRRALRLRCRCCRCGGWRRAKLKGLTTEDLGLNRSGHSTDPKAGAALTFAYKVAQSRGHIEDADFDAVRAAGFSDAEIVDIVAETAFSFITNLFNNTFQTERDARADGSVGGMIGLGACAAAYT